MSDASKQEPSSKRAGVAPRWVFGALLLSFIGAFGAAFWIYQRYVAFERRAARHVVDGAWFAVRADLEKIVLYAPFRDEMLPLVQEPKADPRLKPRLIRLRQHTGVELGVDVREIVFSRGKRPGSWVLAVAGMFPKAGVVQGIHDLLVEEGHQPRFETGSERLFLSTGVVVEQASDNVVLFASDPEALASALPPSDRYQALELGLAEPALSLAFVSGHGPDGAMGSAGTRLNVAVAADQPETLRLSVHEPGMQRSVKSTQDAAALVAKVTGLPRDSIKFEVAGPSHWKAAVPMQGEHLSRAVKQWTTSFRTAAFPGH